MSYATLMVVLAAGRPNAHVLDAVRALAERFDSRVVGVAACRPLQVVCQDYQLPAPCFEEDRKQIDRQLHAAEHDFRTFLSSRAGRIEWRPATTLLPLAVHVAQEARGCDLVIVSSGAADGEPDVTRVVDLTELVMECSRPVLIVPEKAAPASFDDIIVAWKDTREAQRAAADALPLLKRARRVTIVALSSPETLPKARAGIDRILEWLQQHGVPARARIETAEKSNATQLNAIAAQLKADLVVAGAYGHLRGRDWILGGITHDVLHGAHRCTMVSH